MKLTALFPFVWVVVLTVGCHYFYDSVGEVKRIPMPIPDRFPHEFEGEIYRVWMGNEIQIKNEYQTAYLLLEGVNNPDMGDEMEARAIEFVHSLLVATKINAVINSTDGRRRMYAQVYCGNKHVNLELIKSGWGSYDGSKTEFAADFEQAEVHARLNKLGIWQN